MCISRHPNMTRAQFRDYWHKRHGPFCMRNAALMRARKYVQSHTLDSPLNEGLRQSRGMAPEYDRVAEVWFDSEQDLIEGMGSAEGEKLGAALLEDDSNFIDHSKSTAFIVEKIEL